MPVCLRHPDREATARCCVCFKPLCRECVIRRGRHVFCSEQCIEQFNTTTARASAVVQREKQLQRRRLLVRLLTVLGLTVLALVGVFLFFRFRNAG